MSQRNSHLRMSGTRRRSQWVAHRDHCVQSVWRRNRRKDLAVGGERTPFQYGNLSLIATAIVFHAAESDKTANPGKIQQLVTSSRTH
ncbi:hypothetical protein RBSH_05654 [Rhodopirellula baltica SH28]|uniref:Uncharacterized protein n=1 Tax=Rhodopirellula baltica SH28 TaxID=993517 RepID=K5D9C6_RHOBT|nr:hypothetical protein RBSH_05654 [Rhodopirellula baltica SH28]